MTDYAHISAAFAAGLAASIHCMGMCGPLFCTFCPANSSNDPTSKVLYHTTRIASYSTVGAIAGALGTWPSAWLRSTVEIAPWILIAALVAIALGIGQRLPAIRIPAIASASTNKRASLLGLATPLIPCGPLYIMFGVCFVSGSTLAGLKIALAYGLGTLPLLWLAHEGLGRLLRKLSQSKLLLIQKGIALAAAGFLTWKLLSESPASSCPLCH